MDNRQSHARQKFPDQSRKQNNKINYGFQTNQELLITTDPDQDHKVSLLVITKANNNKKTQNSKEGSSF